MAHGAASPSPNVATMPEQVSVDFTIYAVGLKELELMSLRVKVSNYEQRIAELEAENATLKAPAATE